MLNWIIGILVSIGLMKRKPDPVVEPEVIPEEPVVEEFEIKTLTLKPNPKYEDPYWGQRLMEMIEKIVIHQALCDANTLAIHNYHISEDSHLKKGGAPKIAYHYTIEKDGSVYLVNNLTDIVWHCKGQNTVSIGILLCGNFSGKDHVGKSKPTNEQLASLCQLLDRLTVELDIPRKSVFGHFDFGKPACPGYEVEDFIYKYRG